MNEFHIILPEKTFLQHKEMLDGFVFHREVKSGIEVKTSNLVAIDFLKQIQHDNN